jgi:hypothetical protein
MECTHCGEETLLGSLKCLSCGKSLLDDPALRGVAESCRDQQPEQPSPAAATPAPAWPAEPRAAAAPPGFSEETVAPQPRRTLAQMMPGAVDADSVGAPPEAIPTTTEIPRTCLGEATQEILAQRSATGPVVLDSPTEPPPPPAQDDEIGRARTQVPLWMQSQWQGDAPAGGAAPAEPGELPTMAAATEIFCRVCMQPFERPPDDDPQSVCHMCLNLGTPGADLGPNEVQFHPATAPDAQPDAFGQRLGSADFRPRPVSREVKSRSGLIVALVGLFLTAVCAAVIVLSPPPDRTLAFLEGVEPTIAEFDLTPGAEPYVALETKLRYHLVHATRRANFGTDLAKLVDIDQHSSQQTSVGFVREEDGAAVSVVKSECFLDVQRGEHERGIAADLDLYPWIGHHTTKQVLVPVDAAPTPHPDGELLVGRDIAPLLTLGVIETPRGALQPQQTWNAEVRLPAFCDRDGRLVVLPFDCTFTYVGTKLVGGHQCIALRIENTAGPVFLPEVLAKLNRKSGTISGTLFYQQASGFILEAHLDVDVEATRHTGRTEERVHVAGQIEFSRR